MELTYHLLVRMMMMRTRVCARMCTRARALMCVCVCVCACTPVCVRVFSGLVRWLCK